MEVKGLEYLGVVGGRDILIKYFFPWGRGESWGRPKHRDSIWICGRKWFFQQTNAKRTIWFFNMGSSCIPIIGRMFVSH
jgi:hypothetical protein